MPLGELMKDEIALEHFHRYHAVLSIVKGRKVLDIACGEGYGTALLAQSAEKVYGVDIEQSCIEQARQKYSKKCPNAEFLQGEAEQIPIETASIEVVVCFETLEHLDIPSQQKFLKEIKRVLVKRGELIISTPDKANYSDRFKYTNEFHLKEFYKEEFALFLKKYFKHVSTFLQGYEIVSAITNEELKHIKESKVLDWQRDSHIFSRKYLIGVCSDELINKNHLLNSVVFQGEKDYLKLMSRLAEMEAHIIELGSWGKNLDKELSKKNISIENYQASGERQEARIQELITLRKKMEEKMSQMDSEMRRHRDNAEEFESNFRNLENHNKELEKELIERNAIINHYTQMISEQAIRDQHQTQQLDTLLKDKEFLQSRLKSQLEEISRRLDELNKNELLIGKLKEEIYAKEATLADNKKSLADKEASLEEVKGEMEGLERQLTEIVQDSDVLRTEFDRMSRENLEIVERQFNKISLLRETNQKLNDAIEKGRNEYNGLLQVINDNNTIIEAQKQQINQCNHKLEEVKEQLNIIHASEGWKLLKMYYNIKGRVIPEDSNRYNFLKKSFNKLRGKKESYYAPAPPKTNITSVVETKATGEPIYNIIEFPQFDAPVVSIVLPAYNGWDLTYKCLVSIKQNTTGVSYEIIIGDDSSTDETRNIGQYIKNIVVIRNEKNLEFLYNCNRAATFAKGKYILFLNNDTEVMPGWLSSMTDLMERDPSIGMTGSKLIYPNGKLQEAGAIVWNDASGWNFGHRQDPQSSEFNYVKEADYISGASILIRTSLWKDIGGFDTRYAPAYSEDSDLAFEVRKHGYKVVYQPLSEVIHYEGYTHGTDNEAGIKEGGIKGYQKLNAVKFREKWKDVLEKEHFPNGEKVFWARDRSRNRKTILVIDHYVPHYDKDAGSRTTFQLLQLFVEMGYNVKFIGDNFFKHEPYTTTLQQMGIEVLYGPWYAENWPQWLKDNCDMIDYVYMNRPHISVKYIDFIKSNMRAKIVYYGHDLHFVREKRQYEIEKTPELLHSMKEWKLIETSLIQKSDTVLTLSFDEKTIMEKEMSAVDVRVMPAFFYNEFKEPLKDFSKRKDLLFVGGFNHKPNVDAVHWFVREVWPEVTATIKDVRFIIVGSLVPQNIINLQSETISVKGYVTEEELDDIYTSVKMVVVPLRYGAGVKGKTVEAMYHGLPLVSTSFGIEGLENVREVLTPFDDARAFAENIITTYNNEKRLAMLSSKETEYARRYFSKQKVRELISNIFRK